MRITMTWIEKNILLLVVFITGACVLVLEVTATRVLAPYYGSTIYTVSSVIGVILAALSVGYYYGGKLADRFPTARWFYGIILFSGLSVFLLSAIALLFLPLLSSAFSLASGPLIWSLVLFFIPSLLLGTLSPFVIKLQSLTASGQGIGTISGRIFFWSTLGSIFGTLGTGFIFIPHFGVSQIVITVGLVLTIIGLIGFYFNSGFKKRINKNLFFIALIFLISSDLVFITSANAGALYVKDGVYERVTIKDSVENGKDVRLLYLDRGRSSGQYLADRSLLFEYTKYYKLYQVFQPQIKDALIIGGGTYTMAEALSLDLPGANISVSEIEPTLFPLAKKYFNLPEDTRINNYVEDGRIFLKRQDKKYDYIFGDAYATIYSLPLHLTTKEFFQLVNSRLNDQGIFMVNFIGTLINEPSNIALSEIKTFRSVFSNSYFFAVRSASIPQIQNIIFVGVKSDKKIDLTLPEIKNNPDEIISELQAHLIDLDKFDFSKQIILTDNYAPVEYLSAKMMSQ